MSVVSYGASEFMEESARMQATGERAEYLGKSAGYCQ